VLKGQRTWLVWCRDLENTWQAELQQGRIPEELANLVISLRDVVPLDGRTLRTYDPWKNAWNDATAGNGSVRLPPFRRSIILRGE